MSKHYFYLGPPSRYAPKPSPSDLESFPHLPYSSYCERQDALGYLPSCRPYSLTSPDILNPVSENYFWRTNPVFAPGSVREKNKPWDTRHALAIERSNDIMKEHMAHEEQNRLESRKALRQHARIGFGEKKSGEWSTGPHLLSYPSLLDSGRARRAHKAASAVPADPSWYVVRARTPEVSRVGQNRLPVDIIPVGSGYRGSNGTSSHYGGGSGGTGGSTYFTDKNYPPQFFQNATSINDMIRKP